MPVLSFPEDLGTASDLQQYVMFFINVRATGLPQMPGTARSSVTVAPGGGEIGAAVGGMFNAGAGTTVGQYVVPAALSGTNTMNRLDTAIALYIAERPQTTYKANYDNVVDLGTTGLIAKMLSGDKSMADNAKNYSSYIGAKLGSTVTQAVSGANDGISAIMKSRLNPFKQAYFDHMEFRQFQFRYAFMPRTPNEATAVKQIIDLFKFHMHPELAGGSAFMIYPSEFDIVYYWGTEQNKYWHKISTCVLLQLSIDYGGDQYTSFYGGVPSEVYLTLTFKEIEALTKERIAQGY
jgi:hypothetical protein